MQMPRYNYKCTIYIILYVKYIFIIYIKARKYKKWHVYKL